MRIDLDRVLWRTRGRGWDYSFTLVPAHPQIEAWYDFHADAFSDTTPGRGPSNVGGVLVRAAGEQIPFVATTFQDATLRDAAGRPVAHYLVWFPSLSGNPTEFEIPADWGSHVVQAFGETWNSVFAGDGALEAESLKRTCLFLREVNVPDASRVRVRFDRRVFEKKKVPSRTDSEQGQARCPGDRYSRNGSRFAIDVLGYLLMPHRTVDATADARRRIVQAILEGEAHAVGMRGALGTARVVAHGIKAKLQKPDDLAVRVANSFGGAVDDRFTQARMEGIHQRVAMAVVSWKRPRPGFEALVEALLPSVTATAERELKLEIAGAIDADVDDRVVHVLAVKILSLR